MTDSSWEETQRCQVCEGVDQPGLIHNPKAPYCHRAHLAGNDADTELRWALAVQRERERDEEREKFHRHVEEMIEPKLLARLEAVTRERDEYRDAADGMARAPYGEFKKWADRAKAAEAERDGLREAIQNYIDVPAAHTRTALMVAIDHPALAAARTEERT